MLSIPMLYAMASNHYLLERQRSFLESLAERGDGEPPALKYVGG